MIGVNTPNLCLLICRKLKYNFKAVQLILKSFRLKNESIDDVTASIYQWKVILTFNVAFKHLLNIAKVDDVFSLGEAYKTS